MRRNSSLLLALAMVSLGAGMMLGGLGDEIIPTALADPVPCVDDGCIEYTNCLDKFGQPTGQVKSREREGWYPVPGACCGDVLSGWSECFWPPE